ncbi:MAG: DoxX family protein [Phycisphaerae bacterium]|nr:DoxX family protein [Phycisphaerae bacterium]
MIDQTTTHPHVAEVNRVVEARRPLSKNLRIVSWVLRIGACVILAQTLFFKFAAAEESVYIFQTLGVEPWGRILAGSAELIACVLLLVPGTTVFGAALSLAIMIGAIGSHLTKLGIVVKDDGGLLFALAIVVFTSSIALLIIHRGDIQRLLGRILR